jgi:autoinducer 2-degrading protein
MVGVKQWLNAAKTPEVLQTSGVSQTGEWPVNLGVSTMFIAHVFVHVKADQVEAFKAASIENASNSLQEPGVARFDVIQQQDDPTRFLLVEVYRTADDPAKHKETAHYQKWRDTVDEMMAEPRAAIKYDNVYPGENGWDS